MEQNFIPKLTVGILGGMGPYATLAFFEKILKLTPAKKDWNHIHLVIDNNPHIPSRSRAYLYHEETPVKGMIESCKKLQNYPVNVIAIPCNSSMYYLNEVKEEIDIPILNIIEITSKQVKNKINVGARIAVWGATITYAEKLYKPYLENEGFVYIDHKEEDQAQITSYIEEIKKNGGSNLHAILEAFLREYIIKYKPDAIILGCTELGYFSDLTSAILIDSDTELAKHIVQLAYDIKQNDKNLT